MMKFKGTYITMFPILLKKPMQKKFGRQVTKETIKKAKQIYRRMLAETEDIGADNPMNGNIYMGYVFMAICKAGQGAFTLEEFSEVVDDFMHSPLVRKMMGGVDLNTSEGIDKLSEQLHRCKKWADEHPEYADRTWDFNFDENKHRDGFYYHFTRCPIEKFSREHGFLDVLPIACNIDYANVELRRGILHRDHTLGSGGEMCDYWVVGDQIKNPE